jgi:hypothetical protein
MKKRIFTIVALATVFGLLVTGTAAAGGNRTPFTGEFQNLFDSAPQRYWEPGRNAGFWRDMPFIGWIATSDPRVNGTVCTNHNGNYRPAPDDPWFGVQGQMWGKMHIESDDDLDCTNSLDYWEGSFVGDRASNGNEHMQANLKGYGAYAGLQLPYEAWSNPTDFLLPFTVAGEVLNPGGK